MQKADIGGFVATSSKIFTAPDNKKTKFARRLLISTSDNWSIEAEKSITNQDPPFLRIPLTVLMEAQVDWEMMDEGIFGIKTGISLKTPKEHQIYAAEAFHEQFKTHDRGKFIPPCGT
jgi:predicted helicase